MKAESTPEKPEIFSDRTKAASAAAKFEDGCEKFPFHIVPPPPIPGQTGWSIVPL